MEEIPDGAVLQLGIGGMPNAVGTMIAESDLKDLGVHTELYVDSFVEMAVKGRITGNRKNVDRGKQVYAFAAGTKKMYDYIDNNPQCIGAPVDYTNDARVIGALDNFISINNAVDMDLFGQVNAESSGTRHISGAGGAVGLRFGSVSVRRRKEFHMLLLYVQGQRRTSSFTYKACSQRRLGCYRYQDKCTLCSN